MFVNVYLIASTGTEDCDLIGVGEVKYPARPAGLNSVVARQNMVHHPVRNTVKQSGRLSTSMTHTCIHFK